MSGTEEDGPGIWFKNIVNECSPRWVSYALRFGVARPVARELVQEALIKLWQQTKLHGKTIQATAWTLTTLRNLSIDHLRKSKREVELDDQSAAQIPDPGQGPDQKMKEREEMSEVKKAMLSLSPQEQEALRLKFEENLSYKEIAQVMGLTVSHVGVLLHETIQKVRKQIKPEALQPGRPS